MKIIKAIYIYIYGVVGLNREFVLWLFMEVYQNNEQYFYKCFACYKTIIPDVHVYLIQPPSSTITSSIRDLKN